jgi:type IV pilus assembly protein PilE
MKLSRDGGFSLLEMMVALVIMSILLAIALPSYTHYLIRSRRIDATVALILAAQTLERYNTEHNNYTGATLGNGGIYPSTSPNGFYTLTLTVDRNTTLPIGSSYVLQATPTGSQAADTECGIYTLDETGFKTAAGLSDPNTLAKCWVAD